MRSSNFFILYSYLSWKFLKLARVVKNFLKDPCEEDSPIVAPEISHILFTYSHFIFFLYLPILKLLCV